MRFVIVAGGTGGHLYPGIALARALVGHEVVFMVRRGDLGKAILEKEGFPVHEISGQGFPRSLGVTLLSFPFRFILGTLQALLFFLRHRPDGVVGMGGYLSVPAVLLARLLMMKSLIHEQNVVPGLANRLLGHVASSVAVSFEESLGAFPRTKTWVAGLPIRSEMGQVDRTSGRRCFGLELETTTYLVFGGSLGAQKLNTVVIEAWNDLLRKGVKFQVLHVTGGTDYKRVEQLYQNLPCVAHILPYCHEMASAYAACDLVICRAGASTIAELLVAKRPALLVPYPFATDDHQVRNAKVLVDAGLGAMVLEHDLSPARLVEFLLQRPGPKPGPGPKEWSTGAAERLVSHLTRSSD